MKRCSLAVWTLLSLLILTAAAGGLTATAGEDHAVKVVSSYCGMFDIEDLQRRGSGVLLTRKDQVYVLTSDHVVYHANQQAGFCHKIVVNGRSYEAQLSSVSFAHGLALLKLNALPDGSQALSFESLYEGLKACHFPGPAELISYGFTWRSESVTSGKGQVLNPRSERHLLPAIEFMLESDLYSELGMSGGPVFDPQGEGFAGLLSHQFLVRDLGGESRAVSKRDVVGADTKAINGLIIPACPIALWLTDTFAGAAPLALDAQSQMNGQEATLIGQVRFQVTNCQKGEDWEPIGGRISGKAADLPDLRRKFRAGLIHRGSGDGVGIGGMMMDDFNQCSIDLSWENSDSQTTWPFSFQQEWFSAVRSAAYQRAKVTVDSVLLNGEIHLLNGSLSRFFALLRRGGLPLTRVSSLNHPEQQTLNELQVLNGLVSRSMETLDKPWRQLAARDPLVGVLRKEILEVISTVAGGHHQVVCEDRLAQLIQSPAWSRLYLGSGFDSDQVIELKALLNRLKTTLGHLTITRGCQ
ncbi:MAG: trypsin-like peptidase domain-containing protein [Bdellovibrionaceae bacterium]|nr:trypsin-like peptidase domain-containing protein [Bdellovibrionales bacterium]MCB9083004.1 trypsin-like peptidase domain-containing protein [Pseudobdellovibrionaceae bacterium]